MGGVRRVEGFQRWIQVHAPCLLIQERAEHDAQAPVVQAATGSH